MAVQHAFHFDASVVGPRVYLRPAYRTFRQQLEAHGAPLPRGRGGAGRASAAAPPPAVAAQDPAPRLICAAPASPASPAAPSPALTPAAAPAQRAGALKNTQPQHRHSRGAKEDATRPPAVQQTGANIGAWAAAAGIAAPAPHDSAAGQPPPAGGSAQPSKPPPQKEHAAKGAAAEAAADVPPRPASSAAGSGAGGGSGAGSGVGSTVTTSQRSVSGSVVSNAVSDEGSVATSDGSGAHQEDGEGSSTTDRESGEDAMLIAHTPTELLSSLAGVRIMEPRKTVLTGLEKGTAEAEHLRGLAGEFGAVVSCYVRDPRTAVVAHEDSDAGVKFRAAVGGGALSDQIGGGAAAAVGTTSYCTRFLKGRRCRDHACTLAHAFAPVSLYAL